MFCFAAFAASRFRALIDCNTIFAIQVTNPAAANAKSPPVTIGAPGSAKGDRYSHDKYMIGPINTAEAMTKKPHPAESIFLRFFFAKPKNSLCDTGKTNLKMRPPGRSFIDRNRAPVFGYNFMRYRQPKASSLRALGREEGIEDLFANLL